MAAGDIWRTLAVFSDADSGKEYTTHIDVEEATAAPAIGDIGDDWKTWWNTGVGTGSAAKTYFSPNIALKAVTLREIKPLSAVVALYTTGLPIVGTGLDAPMYPSASVLISTRTALVGRRHRGRMFMPPPHEGVEQPDQLISAADASDFADGVFGLHGLLTVFEYQAVVYSKLDDQGEIITDVFCDRRIRQQRRRQVRTPVYIEGV